METEVRQFTALSIVSRSPALPQASLPHAASFPTPEAVSSFSITHLQADGRIVNM